MTYQYRRTPGVRARFRSWASKRLISHLRPMARLSGRWYDYLTNPWRRAHMVRIGLIGLLLMVSGAAGIAFAQQVGGGASIAGQNTTGAVGGTFTAGNLLVAVVTWSSSTASPTDISVPAGWTPAGVHLSTGAGNGVGRAYYLPNNAGGAQTWTWNVTAGSASLQGWAWTIFEFSGVATSSPLDLAETQTATAASSSATHDPGAASGTTQAGDLLISLTGITNSGALTYTASASSVPTAGWNVGATKKSTAGSPLAQTSGIYQILGAATTSTNPHGIITSSVAASGEVFFMTFLAAPAASGPIPSGSARAMDQSREYMLLYQRRARISMPIPPQVNPPYPPTWWQRPWLAELRSVGPRRARRFEVIPPQVNPPMPPVWWTRAFQAAPRAFIKRARRWDLPIQAQVAQSVLFAVWPPRLRRAVGWFRRRPASIVVTSEAAGPVSTLGRRRWTAWLRRPRRSELIPTSPVVAPTMPPVWWRRPFLVALRSVGPRRGRRFEVVPPQVNPPFSNDWWRRAAQASVRFWMRRGKRSEPPWGQQAAAPAPPFIEWWRRRALVRAASRRSRTWGMPEAVTSIVAVRRRLSLRIAGTSRRRRDLPLGQAAAPVNPAFVGWWTRRQRVASTLRRARLYVPPWTGAVVTVVTAVIVGAFDLALFIVGAADSAVMTVGAYDLAVDSVGAADVGMTTGAADFPVDTTDAQDRIP